MLQNGLAGPDLPEALMSHCFVAINNTHAFLHGGIDSNGEKSKRAYIMDMTTREFTPLPDSKYSYSNQACVHVEDKLGFTGDPPAVVVVGGTDDGASINNIVERFNLDSMQWEEHPPVDTPSNTNEWLVYQPDVSFFYLIGVMDNQGDQKVFQYYPPDRFDAVDSTVLPVRIDTNSVIFALPRDMRTKCIAQLTL